MSVSRSLWGECRRALASLTFLALVLLPAVGFAQDIAIYFASTSTWAADIQAKLSPHFTRVDTHDATTSTPTLSELQQYDAVIVYSDLAFANATLFGDTLANYVDTGGRVLVSAGGSEGLAGRFMTDNYAALIGGSWASGTRAQLVADDAAHPILDGVATFDGGSASWHMAGASLSPGATQIAHWTTGEPLVVTQMPSMGRTVALNIFLPSSDARSDFWDVSTDGVPLMVNSLNWLINQTPLATDDAYTIAEDTSLVVGAPGVLSNDSDLESDPMNATLGTDVSNGTLTLNADGSFSYTPDPNFNGTDSFTYEVTDSGANFTTGTVTITVTPVGDAPVAQDDSATTDEEATTTIDVLTNDDDVDGDNLTVTVSVTPANGTATANANGTIDYTPNANFNGSDVFSYEISDGNGGTDTATVTITVNAINDAPVAADDATSTNEDEGVAIDVTANDDDVDGDSLTVTITGAPTNGSASVNGGLIEYTPNANFNGSDSLTYQISDGNGGTDTATVSITVNAVNDAPVATDDTATTDEEVAVTIDVLTNDGDIDGDSLTVTVTAAPANGSTTVNTDGTVDYTPDVDFAGSDVFTYEISDGNGGTDTATVSIDVANLNDAPVFIAPTPDDQAVLTVVEGGTLDFTLSADDADADTLTYAVTTAPSAASFDSSTGVFSWTPGWEDAGSYTWTLEADDGQASDSRSVTVEVSFIDDDADELPDTWETANGLDTTTPDSDGDNIADLDEVGDDLDNAADTDQDGTLDALDDDSDDDGVLDVDEAGDDDLATLPIDTDQDGTPDYRDTDSDDDTVEDGSDNCPVIANTDQTDTDADMVGDACEDDSDNDGVSDVDEDAAGTDKLLVDSDSDSIADGAEYGEEDTAADTDADGTIDALDDDSDGDGIVDADEAGDDDVSTDPVDTDSDGIPDYQDTDSDDDGLDDGGDNCRLVNNPDQTDTDADGEGDACEDDVDGDTILDADDACPLEAGEGSDGCPLEETSGGAAEDSGCGCSSTNPANLPGNALMLVIFAGAMAFIRRRRD